MSSTAALPAQTYHEDEFNYLAPGESERSFDPIARPDSVDRGKILWLYAIPIIGMHLLLPLAFVPWLFSWTGLILIPVGNFIFTSMGIGACYHRLLTHRGFRCPLWFEHFLAVLGICSLQDSPARWVLIHRLHHQNSDRQPDPHSPLVTFFWSHMGWLFVENKRVSNVAGYDRYVRDLIQDRFYRRIERRLLWIWIYAAHAVMFFLAGLGIGWWTEGTYMGGVQFGLSLLLYGVIFRTIYAWHVTWSVNSLAHLWGYRNYETGENSCNNPLVALTSNGEWHNNHHADPRSAVHGFHRWWELDVIYLTLRVLQRFGLVWDIVPRRKRVA